MLELIPLEIVNVVVPEILRRQGKGWGSSTVLEEVEAIFKMSIFGEEDEIHIFDIGANIGLYTEAAMEYFPNSKIYSFEPSNVAFSMLTNKFGNNSSINLINLALGSASGTTKLYSDKNGSGMASLTKRRMDHFGVKFDFAEDVTVSTLDEWCRANDIWPHIIKLDVEGHELDVLNFGTEAIKSATVIQFEFGGCNIDTRTFFQDFWYFFKEFNFDIWRITPVGLDLILDYSEYDECFTTTNYIAIKQK
jgi:FkbM family methyltransferase